MAAPDAPARARFLLLGASNAQRLLPELLREARARLPTPLDVVASHGHGRSYLAPSRVLFRTLDRIAPDAFWERAGRADAPGSALVLDPGNDLAYGVESARLADALEELIARLARTAERVVVAGPPLASLRAVGPLHFAAARLALYPTRRIRRDAVLRAAEDLDARLAAIARAHGAVHVAPPAEWYGLDPVHVRLGRRAEAARALLEAFGPRRAADLPALELGALSRLKPAQFAWFGLRATWPQPSARLSDGTQASWF